jgi:hypothetical protein
MRHFLLAFALATGLVQAAQAQQPTALPSVPTAPATPAEALPAPDFVVGHRYEIKLQSGVGFTGLLKDMVAGELVFEAQGLGALTVRRNSVAQFRDMDAPASPTTTTTGLRPGYYDIGSGSRYFFGPSGRNLRRGEGVLQDVWLFLVGANYGLTDNISLGAYVSLLPGVGVQNQFVMLTPKASFSVGDNWHLGAGALYLRVPNFDSNDSGYGAGLVYGAATRGSADNNISLGVGYGFAGGGIGSTPTIYLAGQTRVSRRVSLLSENYFVAAENPVLFGLYGIKLNWPRLSLGIASGYVGYIDNNRNSGYYGRDDSFFAFGYVYPVYLDLSFRFGKPYEAEPFR